MNPFQHALAEYCFTCLRRCQCCINDGFTAVNIRLIFHHLCIRSVGQLALTGWSSKCKYTKQVFTPYRVKESISSAKTSMVWRDAKAILRRKPPISQSIRTKEISPTSTIHHQIISIQQLMYRQQCLPI